MTTQNFSIEDLANSLIRRLDRGNIFPPCVNNPEALVSSSNLTLRRPRRSPNAFLLCRKNVHQEAKRRGTCNMRVISKVTGMLWRNASPEEKGVYERLADRVNELYCRKTTIVYKGSNMPPSLPKNKETSSKYKPYPSPPQLSAPLTLLHSPLNSSLSFPTSDPSSMIPHTSINNSSNFDQKDEFYFNNSTNYYNPTTEYNQIIASHNNNHNELLTYLYNSYLAPTHFSNL